jgi:hypothetical protein
VSSPTPDDTKRAEDFKKAKDATVGVDEPVTSPLPREIKRRTLVFDAEDDKAGTEEDKAVARDDKAIAEGHKADAEEHGAVVIKEKVDAVKD